MTKNGDGKERAPSQGLDGGSPPYSRIYVLRGFFEVFGLLGVCGVRSRSDTERVATTSPDWGEWRWVTGLGSAGFFLCQSFSFLSSYQLFVAELLECRLVPLPGRGNRRAKRKKKGKEKEKEKRKEKGKKSGRKREGRGKYAFWAAARLHP